MKMMALNIWVQILFIGEVDVEQATQSNLLNHINVLVSIGPMVTYDDETPVFGPP